MAMPFVLLTVFLCASAKPDESCVATLGSATEKDSQRWDQSLLALRSAAGTGTFSEEVRENLAEYQAWSTHHQMALQDVEKSKSTFDQLMAGQSTANSPCTSAMLDLQHETNSITHDLQALSGQVDVHMQTLQLQTGKLNSTMMAMESTDREYSQSVSQCNNKQKQALEDLSRYKAQLQELKQIAKPSSPYTHTGKVEWPPTAPLPFHDDLWSKVRCQSFVEFIQEHREYLPQGINKTDCDADREQLHKVCSDMYISLRSLAKAVKEQSEDGTCVQAVRKKKSQQLVPLVSQRRHEVALIKLSSTKLDALQPVLAHLSDRVNKLNDDVIQTVHPHCAASEVAIIPEMLSHINGLIHSLQECPSQSNVIDNLPEVEEPRHIAYTVCAGDGDCGTDESLYGSDVNGAMSNTSGSAHVQAIMSWGGELE